MYHLKKPGTWYGMLQSSKGDTILIWDSVFPKAEKGKVLMYNTNRNSIVEYVEEILRPKLRELSSEELDMAKNQFDSKLNEIKSEYVTDEDVGTDEKAIQPEQDPGTLDDIDAEIEDDDLILEDEEFEDI